MKKSLLLFSLILIVLLSSCAVSSTVVPSALDNSNRAVLGGAMKESFGAPDQALAATPAPAATAMALLMSIIIPALSTAIIGSMLASIRLRA